MKIDELIQCPLCSDKVKLKDLFEHAKFHLNEDYELLMKYYALTFNWRYPLRCRYKTCKTGLVGTNPFNFNLPMDVCQKCYNSRHRGKKSLLDRESLQDELKVQFKSELMLETVKVYKQRHLDYRNYDKHNFKDKVITTNGEDYGKLISRDERNKGYRVFKCNLCGQMLNYTELMNHHSVHNMSQEDFFIQYQGLKENPKCWKCEKPTKFSNVKFVKLNSNGFNHYCSEDCRYEASQVFLDFKSEKAMERANKGVSTSVSDLLANVPEEDLGANFWELLKSGKLDNTR